MLYLFLACHLVQNRNPVLQDVLYICTSWQQVKACADQNDLITEAGLVVVTLFRRDKTFNTSKQFFF